MMRAAVVGAGGYAGVEVVRLLLSHPQFQLTAAASDSLADQPVSSVYPALLPHCEHVYITKVDACPKADSFFPDLDADPSWRLAWQSRAFEENGLRFQFCDYVNLSLG